MKLLERNENINDLLKLVKENPDLPIVFMVATECVPSDEYAYWLSECGGTYISEYCNTDGEVFFEEDYDDLVEKWIDNNYEEFPDKTDVELEEIAKSYVDNYKWIKAIIVYVEAL